MSTAWNKTLPSLLLVASACTAPGTAGIGAGSQSLSGSSSTVLLKPTAGLGHTGTSTVGCPAGQEWECVTDGTSLASSDGDKTYIDSTAASGRQGTSYSGAPSGAVTQVTTHVVAAAESGASGTVTVALYGAGKLLATGAAHELTSAYVEYSDTFDISTPSADTLQTWVTLSSAKLKFTAIWLAATIAAKADAGTDAAAAHSATLSWTASVTPGVTYDVYRSVGCAGATTLEASGVASTSWIDMSVTTGQTYCYEVTAVNAAGQSGDSNTVEVVIP
jgi:hypothetical protein